MVKYEDKTHPIWNKVNSMEDKISTLEADVSVIRNDIRWIKEKLDGNTKVIYGVGVGVIVAIISQVLFNVL